MTILTVNVSVNGVTRTAAVEQTSDAVEQAYETLVASIADFASTTKAEFLLMSPAQLAAHVTTQYKNFRDLLDLAATGLPSGGQQWYVTTEMAAGIDDLVRSLRAAGWNPSGPIGAPNETIETLKRWTDLYNFGLKDIVTGAQKAVDFNYNIQDLVQSEYISTGNHIIFNALSDLETQIEVNHDTLESLTSLQDILNQVTSALTNDQEFKDKLDAFTKAWATIPASPAPPAPGSNSGNAGNYDTAYIDATKDLFGKAIEIAAPSMTSTTLSDFIDVYNNLTQKITTLTNTIGNAPGSLTAALQQIKDDIDGSAVPAFTVGDTSPEARKAKFAAWIIDNMGVTEVGKAAVAGNFQRNVTKAITQSENLNDTQKTRLQSQLFVFQEFYQSASAILTALNTSITTMAQNISQG